jgi:site-specific recombinase XerD
MLNVSYYLKDAKASGETLLYAFCSIKGQRFPKLYTSLKVHPEKWDKDAQRFRKTFPSFAEANRLLKDIAEALKARYLKSLSEGRPCSVEELKTTLLEAQGIKVKDVGGKSFLEHFEQWINDAEKLRSKNTIKTYRTTLGHLRAFTKSKPFRLEFDNITPKFYQAYLDYLLTTAKLERKGEKSSDKPAGLNNNSAGKNIKILKTFLEWAYQSELHNRLDFRAFKILKHEPEVIYLTEEEKAAIRLLDLSKAPHLEATRDLFIFQCEAGLRVSDILTLRHEQVKGDHLLLRTTKTGDLLRIPLSPVARQILDKYSHLPYAPLPIKSSQKSNDQLKDIAKLAGIDAPTSTYTKKGGKTIHTTRPKWELCSTHVARKTFVTLALEAGMRPEMVMKITGHKDFKVMKRYLKITDTVVEKEMQRLWENQSVMKVS